MPRQAIKTSPAMARFLRECRKAQGLTLREVQELTAAGGESIPSSTVCKIEQGKVEPGLIRVRRLLDVYRKPLHHAADLLELEDLLDPAPQGLDAEELFSRGIAELKKGHLRQGLSLLMPLRAAEQPRDEPVPLLSQKATISMSIGLRQLGKFRLSLRMIETLLSDTSCIDQSLALNAHVQAAHLWMDLGSVEISLAFLGRARVHLKDGDLKGESWILGHEANALAAAGRYDEAISKIEAALVLNEKSDDAFNRLVSHAQLANFLLSAGHKERALEVVQAGLALSAESEYGTVRIDLSLWEGRILVELGEAEAGLARLNQALASAIELDDLAAQFNAHYHLWKAYVAMGNEMRAEFELNASKAHLRYTDEDSLEAREVRARVKERTTKERP